MTGNNDAVNESLSALLDGEHGELDLRRVLKAATTDKSVAEKWSAYQLTRQIVNKDLQLQCNEGFLAGIQEAIADETVDTHLPRRAIFQKYAGKVAVAACFTFVFLIGANQWSRDSVDAPQQNIAAETATAAHEAVAVVPDGFELPPLTARTVSSMPTTSNVQPSSPVLPLRSVQATDQKRVQEVVLSAEQQALLQRLMMKHADSAASNGGLGVMPYTRVNASESNEE